MSLTTEELFEKIIEQVDEVDLIDLLGLTTVDLVHAFRDKIEDNYNEIVSTLEL
jgi:hypothetical protein